MPDTLKKLVDIYKRGPEKRIPPVLTKLINGIHDPMKREAFKEVIQQGFMHYIGYTDKNDSVDTEYDEKTSKSFNDVVAVSCDQHRKLPSPFGKKARLKGRVVKCKVIANGGENIDVITQKVAMLSAFTFTPDGYPKIASYPKELTFMLGVSFDSSWRPPVACLFLDMEAKSNQGSRSVLMSELLCL